MLNFTSDKETVRTVDEQKLKMHLLKYNYHLIAINYPDVNDTDIEFHDNEMFYWDMQRSKYVSFTFNTLKELDNYLKIIVERRK